MIYTDYYSKMNKKNNRFPIFISLSPNVEKDDLILARKSLLKIKAWKNGNYIQELEEYFKKYFGLKYAFSFLSGRASFFAILKSLDLEEKDEILVQGFTCNAVTNPILALKLLPVFVDIEKETLNMDPEDLKRKINSRSRAVLVQHTFGLPAKMDEIEKICKEYNLILMEDCAHSLGAYYRGKKTGIMGKISFFSFGRDKIISSVFGGMVATNDDNLGKKIGEMRKNIKFPRSYWILQQLLHPIIVEYIIKPFYFFPRAGRYALILFQRLKIISKAVSGKEKRGYFKKKDFKRMPNILAGLCLNQIKKIEKFNNHREKISKIYSRELSSEKLIIQQEKDGRIYMRYPVILEGKNTDEIVQHFKEKKIILDDGWRKTPVVPPDTDQKKTGYIFGLCPAAEFIVKNIFNLPTHINIDEKNAVYMANIFKKLLKSEVDNFKK